MRYEGTVYRPPSEAKSLIIQVTIGCAHNTCTFCPMYSDKTFRVRPFNEVIEDLKEARCYYNYIPRIFFADGDAMCLQTQKLLDLLGAVRAIIPECERVSVYGRAGDILSKTEQELKQLKEAGLGIVYVGAESGSAEVLRRVHKGETPQTLVQAVHRAENVGIPISVTFISGLGGRELMNEHAVKTGEMISAMGASYVGLLTLMIAPGTPLANELASGKFEPLEANEVAKETEIILENTHCVKPSILRSNHVSNALILRGTLPQDKERLLAQVRYAKGKL